MTKPLCILAFTLALCLAAPGASGAAPGSLTFVGCLGDRPAAGCTDLAGDAEPLKDPSALAVSDDGRSVYVAAASGDKLTHFVREDGRLVFDVCYAPGGAAGCEPIPKHPFEDAFAVAVSPDQRSVYVLGYYSSSVAHFFRGTDGRLSFGGCVSSGPRDGCTDIDKEPIKDPYDIAVTATSLYVVGDSGFAHFRRAAEGQLTFAGCLNDTGSEGCADLQQLNEPLGRPTGIAVSPGGRAAYVVGAGPGTLSRFALDAQGTPTFAECFNGDGTRSCFPLPGSPLPGANDVVVSADGSSVYTVTSYDTVTHFQVVNGVPTYVGCFDSVASEGCVDLPGEPMRSAQAAAVSPDGRSLYVASLLSHSVSHLVRDPRDGTLTWDGCVADDDGPGCTPLPLAPLENTSSVAVSADGSAVYATAFGSEAISAFTRAGEDPVPTPTPTPPAPPTPSSEPAASPQPTATPADTVAPVVSELRAGRRGVRFRLSEGASVTVRIRRGRRVATVRADGVAGANRVARRLRRGRHRIAVTATDAAGNRSAPATARVRIRR